MRQVQTNETLKQGLMRGVKVGLAFCFGLMILVVVLGIAFPELTGSERNPLAYYGTFVLFCVLLLVAFLIGNYLSWKKKEKYRIEQEQRLRNKRI